MFGWLKSLFDRRCEFYDKCELRKSSHDTCERGPTWFDGIEVRSYCGHYRKLAGWSDPVPLVKE